MIQYYRGHWQNKKFIDIDNSFLLNKLRNKAEINYSLEINSPSSVMIHIRRNEYGKNKLKIEYYLKSLKILEQHISNLELNLFTDDKSIIELLPFKNKLNSIHYPSNNKNDTLLTFSKMIENNHYIIANSTYSYMAAYIGSSKESIVIMPKTWMKNIQIDLSLDKWIKVENSFE